MGQRCNGIHRDAARAAGRRRRRVRVRPDEPTIAAAHRRVPHLRLGRTGRVLEALIPAVLEQRVYGKDALRAWRALVTKFGSPAPGPAPAHMRVPPPARGVAAHSVVGVPPRQRRPRPGPHARRLCASGPTRSSGWSPVQPEQARTALMSLPGVGEWTAAETAQRAFGDADALSVGDYHLAQMVGWRLLGRPIDDPAMVELLEPLRPHRHRAVRLLEVSGTGRNPPRRARVRRFRTCARSDAVITALMVTAGYDVRRSAMTEFTIPGMSDKEGNEVADLLQKQLSTYNDLHLTLKHVHWNVVGPNFIGVHEMIDPQVELVRGYADEVAERIAALGKSPQGTPGAIIKDRTWDDYSVGPRHRAGAPGGARPRLHRRDRGHPQGHRHARGSRPGRRRTCSSITPASWRSSSGSSVRTWRTPAASWPARARRPRRAAASRAKKKAPVK